MLTSEELAYLKKLQDERGLELHAASGISAIVCGADGRNPVAELIATAEDAVAARDRVSFLECRLATAERLLATKRRVTALRCHHCGHVVPKFHSK